MSERRALRDFGWLPLVLVALMALLAALAALQFRWTGELGEAERERLRLALEERTSQSADEFARALTTLYLALAPESPFALPSESAIGSRFAAWRAGAPQPALVGELLRLEILRGQPTQLRTRRYDPARGTWSDLPWPPADRSLLAETLRALPQQWPGRGHDGARREPEPPPLHAPRVPALLYPLVAPPPREGERRPEPTRSAAAQPPERQLLGWLVVVLDAQRLARELLAPIAQRHFAPGLAASRGENEMLVQVELPDGSLVALVGPDDGLPLREAECSIEIFRLLRGHELRALLHAGETAATAGGAASAPSANEAGAKVPAGGGAEGRGAYAAVLRFAEGGEREATGWRLLAGRRDGTLDEVVARSRRRNLALGLGVLAVLGAGVAAAVAGADRARRLARRELAFAAAVSHELRTPLAAIRALAENLRDGLAPEPDRVREYGSLILAEGERLSSLVEGTLAAARGAERAPLRGQPVAATELLRIAAERCAALPGGAGLKLVPAAAGGEPWIDADRESLVRALVNVLANALRFGGLAPLVEASVAREGDEVVFRVADRGPGVARDEIPHLFEPFFRGRRAAELGIPGSGLGLFLVQRTVVAHGGRVEVGDRDGGGTLVTIALPAGQAPAPAA